ncbi:NgoMIV family type II restriction endonuclease [Acidicapsa dinghuensis]|uniref:NgoMIV family type II restriction endonuclease n=1 Tax=Acidicapsa dinghuensis TaxID=2218256 RepID=A0ABW1ENZ8_9BACT|nr:NgoMIV family type II restriction endonuclease [Acidicapsa dinghuensis]
MTNLPSEPQAETLAVAPSFFAEARRTFHAALLGRVLFSNERGIPANADSGNKASVAIAKGIVGRLGTEIQGERLAGQMSGREFEDIVCSYLAETFSQLAHLRPGLWSVQQITTRNQAVLARFEQYSHLVALAKAAARDPELAAALGNDYTIAPDIVIIRGLESDARINSQRHLVDESVSRHASLRERNDGLPILHASISCKWTMRSDRAQNARSEALNLIRNRKGRLPHVVVVTGEPTPSRLSALALGTGDIDCVYHFALPELVSAVEELDNDDTSEQLKIMIEGKRLKDISDLPLDLAV